ncbi:hypothetical protein PPYR_09184 [Photinus pyralis]|uniref:Lipid-binding serum glycoprotein N-terminal domain-containing protein n=1 Tax=Photinus pyralis TaxID=7054 RepID=A0A5N4ALJ5_PHOPY|nr:uncharacterized protein LOC116172225 [Photinus pyralis]KAB0798191.1 hypothetical protein PPYR_09184 [Photinus pyralis]
MSPKTLLAVLALLKVAEGNLLNLNLKLNGFDLNTFTNTSLRGFTTAMSLLDPLTLKNVSKSIHGDSFSADIVGHKVQLKGFSHIVATFINTVLSPPTIETNLRFKKIELNIPAYTLAAKAAFADVFGNGSLTVRIEQLNVFGTAHVELGITGVRKVKDLKLTLRPSIVDVKVTGLLNNEPLSKVLSTAITSSIPPFMERYKTVIGNMASSTIKDVMNGVLSGSIFFSS